MKNDRKIIFNQLSNIYINYKKYDILMSVNYPSFKPIPKYRFNIYNYEEKFYEMYDKGHYSIVLYDYSMIVFDYRFDENDYIISHSLSFIPNIIKENDLIEENEIEKEKVNMLSKYLRVDFTEEGFSEYHHSKVHFHLGIFNNDLRITSQCILYPNEFLYIILKYYYKDDSDFTNNLLIISNKACHLTENEQTKLRILFG